MSERSADPTHRQALAALKAAPWLFALGLAGGVACLLLVRPSPAVVPGWVLLSLVAGSCGGWLLVSCWRRALPAWRWLIGAYAVAAFGLLLALLNLPLTLAAGGWKLVPVFATFFLAGLGLKLWLLRPRLAPGLNSPLVGKGGPG